VLLRLVGSEIERYRKAIPKLNTLRRKHALLFRALVDGRLLNLIDLLSLFPAAPQADR
jgi:hypothetical protein